MVSCMWKRLLLRPNIISKFILRDPAKQIFCLTVIGLLVAITLILPTDTPVTAGPVLQTTPVSRPTPVLDTGYSPKMAVVELVFVPHSVTLDIGYITKGYSRGLRNGPPQLQVQIINYVGEIVDTFNLSNPLYLDRINADGTHTEITLNRADIAVNFEFWVTMKTMRLEDLQNDEYFIEVDLEPFFQSYCLENPGDLDCVPDLIPYFFGPGWEIDNPTLSPEEGRLTVEVVVENLGGNPSEAGVPVVVTISTSDTPPELLGEQSFRLPAPLLPGEKYTEVVEFMLPDDIPEGEYLLETVIDPDVTYRDLTHTNNKISVLVRIVRP